MSRSIIAKGAFAPKVFLMSSLGRVEGSYKAFLEAVAHAGVPAAAFLTTAEAVAVEVSRSSIKAVLSSLEVAGNAAFHPPTDVISRAHHAVSIQDATLRSPGRAPSA